MADHEYIRTLQVGSAQVTLINVGDLRADLASWFKLDPQLPGYEHIFGQAQRVPIQCMLVQLDGTTTLVDASLYHLPEGSPYAIPSYTPPPGLLARLHELGVLPETVDQVVITHLHFDHYSGLTEERDGAYVPSFPNARVYVGRADLDDAEMQQALGVQNSLAWRTLRVLQERGMLETISGDRDLPGGIRIVAAPGETLGHQIIRVHSDGQTFYSMGDLYHHPVEIEHPEWGVWWADSSLTAASRAALVGAALAENAFVSATHLRTVGRLRRTGDGVKWDDV